MIQLRTKATQDFDGLLDLLGMSLREEFGAEGVIAETVITIHVQGSNYSREIARYSDENFPQEIAIRIRKHPFSGAEEDALVGVLSHTAIVWILSRLKNDYKHRIELLIASECGRRRKVSSVIETGC